MITRVQHFEVLRRIVVLVTVTVMHVLPRFERAASNRLPYHTMLVSPVQFPVGIRLWARSPCNLCQTIIGPPDLFWRQVVRVSVAAHALCVLPAHAMISAVADCIGAPIDRAARCRLC